MRFKRNDTTAIASALADELLKPTEEVLRKLCALFACGHSNLDSDACLKTESTAGGEENGEG